MKITMYELLGMVKDDKAPKKIKYNDYIYTAKGNAIENFVDYCSEEDEWCFNHYIRYENLNDEVEILEEEKKIPKKINNGYIKQAIEDMKEARFNSNDMAKICNRIGWLMENRNELSNKIDEIIDYLDYLKSKGE